MIYIYTENTFRPQKIHQIAELRGRAGRSNSAYLDLYDDYSNPLEDYEEKIDHTWELIQKHGKAVMCCVAGISRSNAIALGVLVKYFKMDFDEAWALIRKQVPDSNIRPGHISQLRKLFNTGFH
jgi:protein-tyrosine phosphatase